MLLSPCLEITNSIKRIQPSMMCVSSNCNPCATIISCYSPANASDETDIITFYNKLSFFVRHIPKHNILIIGGDMIAQIGKDRNNQFCLHNLLNRKGKYLGAFSLENRLARLNTKFQKGDEKLWGYI